MAADTTPLELTKTTLLNGRPVGRLAYGCWRLPGTPQAGVAEKIQAALEIGANVIDTADVYGAGEAESMLGRWLGAQPSRRDHMTLVTKGGISPPLPYNSSKDYLIAACEASLRRLQTDHVDLYLIHRPDLLTGAEEAAAALTALKDSGKVLAVGVSNHSLEQTRALQAFLDFPLTATQPEISAWVTDSLFDGILDHAQTADLLPMAWSPLAGGLLATGKAPPDGRDRFEMLIAVIDRIAAANDVTRDCVAVAWLLAHPAGIMPILGTQAPGRIRSAARALEVRMTRRDWYEILEAGLGRKMP